MSVKLSLKKPVEIAGETISELSFDDLTVRMIREIGMPFTLDTTGKSQLSIDPDTVAKYVHKLAKVPPSTVDKLSPADFLACQAVIMGFFGE